MNNCSFMGRITQDIELKNTPNGVAVCSFNIAVDRPRSKEKIADFFTVVAWRGTAEFICKYFRKGQKIALTGTLTTRKWEDKNNQKRIAYEIVADQAFFCEKAEGATAPTNSTSSDLTPASGFAGGSVEDFSEIEDEDDLPF